MNDLLYLNGIDGISGRYSRPPMSRNRLDAVLRRKGPASAGVGRGLMGEPDDLASAGWGVVFARDADPAVREALAPLLAHRRVAAAAREEARFRVCEYREGESKLDFSTRYGAGRGPVDPRRLPYYLLLVGDLDAIPFSLQHQLGVQHAVGRLAFDAPWAFAEYAASVLAAEAEPCRRRRVDLVGVAHPGDPATQLSARHLVQPLADRLAPVDGWSAQARVGKAATKAHIDALLHGEAAPALLFFAGHGAGYPCGHPRQRSYQGALVCQDWPGPRPRGGQPLGREHLFAAADVGRDANVHGLVAFLFGCHTAGTPRWDDFADGDGASDDTGASPLAPVARVARLPQRLLSHPRGAALAVIGHIERAWSYSFHWGSTEQLAVFEATIRRLLAGHRVGHALEYFHQRYAELAAELAWSLRPSRHAGDTGADELAATDELWTAATDARNYALLGDPAVRLAV